MSQHVHQGLYYKMGPFVLFIQGLKKKYISGLSVAEKKTQKFTNFLKSNLKYKSFSIHYYSSL